MRKPIFDAIRTAKGSLSPDDVTTIDAALDKIGVARDGARLGKLSERYESGGRGPGTVSSGVNDPGGVSYGTYQLASKTGTLGDFLEAEGKPWRDQLPATPGSSAFSAIWKAIAAREPEKFGDAQHAFIERTHYRPCVNAVKAATGFDIDARSLAVRDAVWSIAVQHGRAAQIVTTAVRAPGAVNSDRALVNALYDARTAYVRGLLAKASGGNAATFKTLVDSRYPDERRRALEMLA